MNLTKDDFEEKIQDKLAVIDFYTPWCSPCRAMSPILDEIEKENSNLLVGKVNIDKETHLRDKYNVSAVPTIMFFKNGVLQETILGFQSKVDLESKIKELTSKE